jgi:hypothetical protein
MSGRSTSARGGLRRCFAWWRAPSWSRRGAGIGGGTSAALSPPPPCLRPLLSLLFSSVSFVPSYLFPSFILRQSLPLLIFFCPPFFFAQHRAHYSLFLESATSFLSSWQNQSLSIFIPPCAYMALYSLYCCIGVQYTVLDALFLVGSMRSCNDCNSFSRARARSTALQRLTSLPSQLRKA